MNGQRVAAWVGLVLVLTSCGRGGSPHGGRDDFVGDWGSHPGLQVDKDGTYRATDGCSGVEGTWAYEASTDSITLHVGTVSSMDPCGYQARWPWLESADRAVHEDGTLRVSDSSTGHSGLLDDDAEPRCEGSATLVKETDSDGNRHTACRLPPGSQ